MIEGAGRGSGCLSRALWREQEEEPMGSRVPASPGSCGPVTQVFSAAVKEKKNPKKNPVSIVTQL